MTPYKKITLIEQQEKYKTLEKKYPIFGKLTYNQPTNFDMKETVLTAFTKKNDNLFVEIYKQYYVPLINEARRKTNSLEIAEDLVQDLFAQLYMNPSIESNIEGYLFTALKRKILNYWRHEKVHLKYVRKNENKEFPNTVFESIETKELSHQIDSRIAKLPPQCQKIFRLKKEENYTNKEIAILLNISLKTVETHVSKALRYLRNHLNYPLILLLTFNTVLNGILYDSQHIVSKTISFNHNFKCCNYKKLLQACKPDSVLIIKV